MTHSRLNPEWTSSSDAVSGFTPPSSNDHHQRSDSKLSIYSNGDHRHDSQHGLDEDDTDEQSYRRPWVRKSQSYMDSLVPPSQENFERIARIQEEKEQELRRRDREIRQEALDEQRLQLQRQPELSDSGEHRARSNAARLIQKTYRGHRTRREMEGFGLDPGTRWISAIREAEFREITRPRSATNGASSSAAAENSRLSNAQLKWKKASIIARRAGHDDLDSDDDDDSSISSASTDASPEEKDRIRQLRDKLLAGRKHQAQMMGLQYFLEMVDLKHRYGSNLRMYHSEWKKSDTKENFFYWLDYGEGKNIELDACPRDRLEREKIRYLSREERQYYLVKIDDEGRLCWAKNGARIDTTMKYKDSIHGIVPADDPTPPYNPETQPRLPSAMSIRHSSSPSISSIDSRRAADRAAKYADPGVDDQQGMKKVTHISASTVWNKLLRRSVRDGTWIFVADTSFRLYVGIKNSGAFQHSSFLQGSRISAAGLIKIKNGRISSLSPLSGHYRPPASNFHAFVKAMKEGGVDMSHVSISKSYAILVGLEMYVKTRRKSKRFIKKMLHQKDKIVDPEEVQQREEDAKDKSQSAQREREVIQQEEAEREANSAAIKLMEKLKIAPREPATESEVDPEVEKKSTERLDGVADGKPREQAPT